MQGRESWPVTGVRKMGVWLWSSMVREGSGCCMESRDGVVGAGLRG